MQADGLHAAQNRRLSRIGNCKSGCRELALCRQDCNRKQSCSQSVDHIHNSDTENNSGEKQQPATGYITERHVHVHTDLAVQSSKTSSD